MPAIKSKLSFTFLGTGYHRDTNRSVLVSAHDKINKLAENPNSDIAAWLIDGPGCEGTSEHPTPGTFYVEKGKKIANPVLAKEKLDKFRYAFNQTYRLITGEGIEHSLLEATTVLNDIIEQNGGKLPKEINLQGFSRGADSCVRFANIIYLFYPNIKVNLFLIDPVPGPGRRDQTESYYIPPNINHCDITLMLDEHRLFFDPQHEDRYIFTNPNTKVGFHYMAGRHGAALASKENSPIMPKVTQTLVQDSLLKFNIETGILPSNATNEYWHKATGGRFCEQVKLEKPEGSLSSKERFSLLCTALQAHKNLAKRNVVKLYPKRRIHKEREHYVLDSELFIDAEHRKLFKELYPAIFNWFFEKNILLVGQAKAYTRENVFSELQTLQADSLEFHKDFLVKFGIRALDVPQGIPESQGKRHIEESEFHNTLVHDELSYLQFCLNLIVNEYHYRVPETWLGNWFPGSDDTFYKSYQSTKIATKLRQDLEESKRLPPKEAKKLLKETILNIKGRPSNEFFYQQVSKIIPDSTEYVASVIAVLNRSRQNLPTAYSELVDKTLSLIHMQMKHPLKDDYQKRAKVQTYLLSLNTALHKLNVKLSSKNILCEELLDNLNQLSRPSYAEELTLDIIIRDLQAYKNRQIFFSYFPFSTSLGFYDPESVRSTEEILVKLLQIRHSKTGQSNLNKVEQVLKDASLKFAKIHNEEETHGSFIFWRKHVSFKASTLSKIVENHLKKITHISKLIFSIPVNHNEIVDSNVQRTNPL